MCHGLQQSISGKDGANLADTRPSRPGAATTRAPAVSVVMPVYNAQRYLDKAITSILAQTFTDFELLIIDDGSTDRSLRILRRYERRDRRVRLVTRENRGLVHTLNEMIGMARGEFLARMDADDIALPSRFGLQVAYLREHPEVVCLGGAQHWIDERGINFSYHSPACGDTEIQEALLGGDNPMGHPCIMMRREAVLSVGGYDPEMKAQEDYDLWLKLGERGRLANLDEFIMNYRMHSQSKMNKDKVELVTCREVAVARAWERRGIEPRPLIPHPDRPAYDKNSIHDHLLKKGWGSLFIGRQRAAIGFGFQCVRMMPFKQDGWWLLRAALKPSRKGVET